MPVKRHRASDYLKTQEDIVAYLNAAVEEMGDGDTRAGALLINAAVEEIGDDPANRPTRAGAYRNLRVCPEWIE